MVQTMIWRNAAWRTNTPRRRARRSPALRMTRRVLQVYRVAPLSVRMVIAMVFLLATWATLNWIVQVARKPSEILFPVSDSLAKSPAETWRQHGPLFEIHSTAVITPELLASLAQVESSGNPVARTYWRWRFSWNPFEVYRPASSAVGMFQMTDGTFAEARRYCIHDHVVVEDGSWHDPRSCWFNATYTRVVPGHAVEMTAALLGRAHDRPSPHRHRLAAAASGSCGSDPPVRERGRRRLRAPRVPAETRPAMRRSRCPPLPDRSQRAEAAVRATPGRLNLTGEFPFTTPSRLDGGNIDLRHRHHRLESPPGLIATSGKRVGQHARRDLPGEAPAILTPTALAFLAAIADDRVPVAVRLFLIVCRYLKGKSLVVFEILATLRPRQGMPRTVKLREVPQPFGSGLGLSS